MIDTAMHQVSDVVHGDSALCVQWKYGLSLACPGGNRECVWGTDTGERRTRRRDGPTQHWECLRNHRRLRRHEPLHRERTL